MNMLGGEYSLRHMLFLVWRKIDFFFDTIAFFRYVHAVREIQHNSFGKFLYMDKADIGL